MQRGIPQWSLEGIRRNLNWNKIELVEIFTQISMIKNGDKCVWAINYKIL